MKQIKYILSKYCAKRQNLFRLFVKTTLICLHFNKEYGKIALYKKRW